MKASEVQQIVTDKMVEWIKTHDDVPWSRPWDVASGQPRSMSTGKLYRGMNVWLLGLTALEKGYSSPWWGTYNQIAQLSGMEYDAKRKRYLSPDGTPRGVRAGEKSTRIYYWELKTYPDPTPDNPKNERKVMFAKVFVMFNACQADGLPEKYFPQPGRQNEELPESQLVAEAYLANGPELLHGGSRASYTHSEVLGVDQIHLPPRDSFHTPEDYYWALFHEMIHSTGHPKRLKRDMENFDHDRDKYGREELAAQMGASMLATMTGIENGHENSAAYVASWLRAIKGDITLLPKAASLAQEAVDYIMKESE